MILDAAHHRRVIFLDRASSARRSRYSVCVLAYVLISLSKILCISLR